VIAGKSLSFYETYLPAQTAIIRLMPNTPARVNMGMCAGVANAHATPAARDAISALMRSAGQMLWLSDDAQMHGFTAIAGSGPAYVFYLIECFISQGLALGFSDEQARIMAAQTFAGAAQMVLQSDERVATLRNNVTSPNGTTQAGLEALMGEPIEQIINHVVAAARDRSETLMHES
jgi:pyrroline-5-carboxylate reductase